MGQVLVKFWGFFESLPRVPHVMGFICAVWEGEHSQHVLKTKVWTASSNSSLQGSSDLLTNEHSR